MFNSQLIEKFKEHQTLEKYDESLSSLKTFTAHETLNRIRDMRKSYNTAYGKNREKILRVFHSQNRFIPENYFCVRYENEDIDDKQEPDKDDTLLVKDQAPILNRLIDYRTPEDILIEKEALVFAEEYFDEIDLKVLRGEINRKEGAFAKSIPYGTYRKQLQRKINSFKVLAARAGHC